MSVFWFSRDNLERFAQDVLTLFAAADSDMDDFETTISSVSSDIEDIRGVFIDGDVDILVVDDTLYDSNNVPLLSSGDESVKASIIYERQVST